MSRAHPARFVDFTVAPGGGLRIAATRSRDTVDLVLRADHAEARFRNFQPVVLPWSAFGEIRLPGDDPGTDRWALTHWRTRRGAPMGIAIRVTGHLASSSHEVIDATTTEWRELQQWMERLFAMYGLAGHPLPLVVESVAYRSVHRELTTLSTLTRVLAQIVDVRSRLADDERVARLAADLSHCMLGGVGLKQGARRDTIDILVALRSASCFHPFGRPLSREQLPAPDTVLERVRVRLESNPFRKGRQVDDDTIMRVARSAYLDVEPWPFAALVD